MKKLSILLLFVSANAFAEKGEFFCHSDMMVPYNSFDKAYIQSIGCEKIESDWGNPLFGKSA